MKRVTVGGLTPARSANRATLSRPAIGYDASSARARRRSAGLRESRRWRTSSPTRWSVTDITFHPKRGYFGTFLTNPLCSPVILSVKPCPVKSGPVSESPPVRVAAPSTTCRTSGRSRRWARSLSTCRLGPRRSPTSMAFCCRVVGTWTPPSTERSLTPRSGRSTASSTPPSSPGRTSYSSGSWKEHAATRRRVRSAVVAEIVDQELDHAPHRHDPHRPGIRPHDDREMATGLAHPFERRDHARRLVDLHHLADQPRRNRRLSVCGRDVDKIARLHVADDPSVISSANRQPSSSCLCKHTLQISDGG